MNSIKINNANLEKHVKRSFSDCVWKWTSYAIVIFFALICLVPFLLVIIILSLIPQNL